MITLDPNGSNRSRAAADRLGASLQPGPTRGTTPAPLPAGKQASPLDSTLQAVGAAVREAEEDLQRMGLGEEKFSWLAFWLALGLGVLIMVVVWGVMGSNSD